MGFRVDTSKLMQAPVFDWTKTKNVPPDKVRAFAVRELRKYSRFNWVGIYWIEGDELVLKDWDGPEATEHVRIPIGTGICGLAARTGTTINAGDVNADRRYLACFRTTRSELVVPIKTLAGNVLGEIDIDSDTAGDFSASEVKTVEQVAQWIGLKSAT